MNDIVYMERIPVLALRGLTIFPKQLIHFDVGRDKSLKALEMATREDQRVFLVPQKDLTDDDPSVEKLFEVGVVAHIKQLLKVQGDLVRVLVYGEYRATITACLQTEPCIVARTESVSDVPCDKTSPRIEASMRDAMMLFDQYLELTQRPAQELQLQLQSFQ